MRALGSCMVGLVLLGAAGASRAYQYPSHHRMSEAAVEDSVLLSDPAVLQSLGLTELDAFPTTPGTFSSDFTDGCARMKMLRIPQLIACGAQFEDAPHTRVLNHFLDPTNNQRLTIGGISIPVPYYTTSPDWALDEHGNTHEQYYSYGYAREYLYKALTLTTRDEDVQRRSWGQTFQTLGQVIHHLQDMAQPQHVRNDQHLDVSWIAIPVLEKPSWFEASTANLGNQLGSLLITHKLAPTYPGNNPDHFLTPRDFWKNSNGTGIAKWTNENFVSIGTNFESNRYDLPNPAAISHVPAQELSPPLPASVQTLCDTYPNACVMTFFSTNPGQPSYVERASTLSMFDQYFQLVRPGQRVFSLNEYNFADIRMRTMPMGVAYSAGLINYFFRGRLEISAPAEGVYAVLDHAVENQRGTNGFRKLKVRVRNITSSTLDGGGTPIIEPMAASSPGALRAVVKYNDNTCYQPDLSGEYGSPGIDWHACRHPLVDTVVSAPIAATSAINGEGQEVAFDFTDNPIPINATDLRLRVVYRGGLGEETDAVVAATKDISEPTYLFNYSRWDQYTYCSYWPVLDHSCSDPHSYAEWCLGNGGFPSIGACNEARGLTYKYQLSNGSEPIPGYDPAGNPVVPPGTWADLSLQPPLTPLSIMQAPVGTLTRVAVLVDTVPGNTALEVQESVDTTHANANFQWRTGTLNPTINQYDDTNDTLTPSVRYLPGRGVFLPESENALLTSGDASPMPTLTIAPSEIRF